MSSHHFVRDKQEPALIIANGQACSDHLLNQLLEWCPFVLVLDGALDRVLMKRIKVDAVLGDFDSIEVDRSSVDKFQEVTWIDAPNQDKTDLEKGIEYLIENGHKAANIVWATGKRLDHTINNVLSMAKYQSQIELVLLDDHSKCVLVTKAFSKYYVQGTKLSILPLNPSRGVNSKGLKYELTNAQLSPTKQTSSSNEVQSNGVVELTVNSGCLLLIESVD